jgi:hypothetical protein
MSAKLFHSRGEIFVRIAAWLTDVEVTENSFSIDTPASITDYFKSLPCTVICLPRICSKSTVYVCFITTVLTLRVSPPPPPQNATAPSGPGPPHSRGFKITLRHTTLGRTPLDEGSARSRPLYLSTHNTHNRQTSMPPAGFEPAIPANVPLQDRTP